jgi:UDP-galactose transporter
VVSPTLTHFVPCALYRGSFSFWIQVLSSVVAGVSDLSSTVTDDRRLNSYLGYFWMSANCLSSAFYVIYMRKSIKQVQFRDFDTVYYNNLLTAPMFLVMSLLGFDSNWGSFWTYYSEPIHYQEFQNLVASLLASGVSAFAISYASAWCMRTTNSTTYSMVGALNKLPIAISGLVFFRDQDVTVGNVGSIILGFIAGLVYTKAKLIYDKEQRSQRQLYQKVERGEIDGQDADEAYEEKRNRLMNTDSTNIAVANGEKDETVAMMPYAGNLRRDSPELPSIKSLPRSDLPTAVSMSSISTNGMAASTAEL